MGRDECHLCHEFIGGHEAGPQCGFAGDHGTVTAHRERGPDDRASDRHRRRPVDLQRVDARSGVQVQPTASRDLTHVGDEVEPGPVVAPQGQAVQGQRRMMADGITRPGACHGEDREAVPLVHVGSRPQPTLDVGSAADTNELASRDRATQLQVVRAHGHGLGGRDDAVLTAEQRAKSRFHAPTLGGIRPRGKGPSRPCGARTAAHQGCGPAPPQRNTPGNGQLDGVATPSSCLLPGVSRGKGREPGSAHVGVRPGTPGRDRASCGPGPVSGGPAARRRAPRDSSPSAP